MFPNADDAPSLLAQCAIDDPVTGLVGGHLLRPEDAVVDWKVRVPGATVPEAAVHEYCDFLFWKDKVGLAKKRTVATPSGDVVLAEDFDEGQFGFLVAVPTNSGHDFGTLGFGENVRHWRIGWK